MTIRAFIFDFDGLIVDTETAEFESWCEVYAQHDCELSFDTWAQCIGRPHGSFDAYAYLEQLCGQAVDREAIRARRRECHGALVHSQPARPGIEEYLVEARRRDIRIGLASSSTRTWVKGHLERLGLAGHFEYMVCCEDVIAHKPNPMPYRACLDRFGCSATEAIAFEDSPNGIAAAKAAGLFCVAVPNPVTAQLDLRRADLQVDSLATLPMQRLLTAVEALNQTPGHDR